MIDEAGTRREEPVGLRVEECRSGITWPSLGQEGPRETRVGEEELSPLVDELAADRERVLVRRPRRQRADEGPRIGEPSLIRTANCVEVPRPPNQFGVVGFVVGSEPLGVNAFCIQQGV